MNKVETTNGSTNGTCLNGKTNGKTNGSCNGNGTPATTANDAQEVDMYVISSDQ